MALSGVVGNHADRWFCTHSRNVWRQLREGATEPRNGDLNRAIRRSQLLALKLAVTFYAKLPHPGWREFPGYSPEDITTPLLTWINRALVKDEPWTTNPEQQRQTEERIERAFTHPEPHDGTAAQRQQELRDIALALTLIEVRQHVPTATDWPRFETLLRQGSGPAAGEYPGWWRLFRAFLAEEIKRDDRVRAILAEQGIARILETQADLVDAVGTLQAGLEPVLAQLAPALTDLRTAASDLQNSAGRIEAALLRFDDAARRLADLITAAVDENARKWFGIRRNAGKETPRAERIKDRPTELLIARYCIVPFLDRGGLLTELLRWATDTAGPRAHGRLYVGPGGAGKTRLGIELIDALHRRGWRTTFLSQRDGAQLPPGALADNMRADTVPGICIVLDYAEGQIPNLEQVAQAAAVADEDGPPIRILAFARSAEGWWEEFASRRGPDIVFDRKPRQDVAGALNPEERQTLFAAARAAFIQQRQAHGLTVRDAALSPDLSAADSPLLVAANAYLDAGDIARARKQSVFQVLFEEEQHHWRRIAGTKAADEVKVEALARAATQVTLVLGASEAGTLALIRADPFGAKVDPRTTLQRLRHLYGRHEETPQEADFIAPIEPDLLGEHAAMTVLGRDTDGLLAATLRTALAGAPLFDGDVAAILTVLTRSTHPVHEQAIEVAANRAIGAVTATVPTLSPEDLVRLNSALPETSVALLELSAIIAQHAAAALPGDTSEAGLAERARRLNTLGVRLSNFGRREEALAASEEAVRHYRELVGKNRDAFLRDLARALNNLGILLSNLGRREEALAASEEAVRHYRGLVGKNRDAFLPDLASALNNVSGDLSNLGRREEALAASEEAVRHYRELVGKNRDAFLPDLASALNNVSVYLSNLGRREEALAASEEAVGLRCELVGKNRDAFLPDLASALNNLGIRLSNLGRREEALAASEEAVGLRRELVGKNRDAFLPDLVLALGGYGSALLGAERADQAADAFAEAIEAVGPLAEAHRAAFGDVLGNLVRDLKRALRAAGREADVASVLDGLGILGTAEDDAE
jgi:tetratricopeptide (TPR) repeat protein